MLQRRTEVDRCQAKPLQPGPQAPPDPGKPQNGGKWRKMVGEIKSSGSHHPSDTGATPAPGESQNGGKWREMVGKLKILA